MSRYFQTLLVLSRHGKFRFESNTKIFILCFLLFSGTSRQPLIPPKQLHSTNSTNNGYLQQRPSIKYIEWSDDYYETLVTSRLVKPMVKDPYLPTDRFKKQAVETIVPDVDPALILTPASAVRQTKFEILKAPRPISKYIYH